METDRNVSEYMQKRNICATNIARILSAQLLIVAVFLCAYVYLQNEAGYNYDLSAKRLIVKGMLVILSMLIALAGVIVMRGFTDFAKRLPDDIGLRQSHEILDYAYSVAKDALVFRMTLGGVMLTAGCLASLLALTIFRDSDNIGIIAKIILFVSLAIAVLLFVPSFDRMKVYRHMLASDIRQSTLSSVPGKAAYYTGVIFFITMPVTVCTNLLWRYFGNNRTIAWIVYPAAGLLFVAVAALINSPAFEKHVD